MLDQYCVELTYAPGRRMYTGSLKLALAASIFAEHKQDLKDPSNPVLCHWDASGDHTPVNLEENDEAHYAVYFEMETALGT